MSARKAHDVSMWRQQHARILLASTVLVLGIGWGIGLWRFPSLSSSDIIPLHYNIYFGVDSVGPWWRVLMIPGFATLVFLLNTLILATRRHEDGTTSVLLLASSLLVAVLCDVALVFILLANV